jgi:hypothetical protein
MFLINRGAIKPLARDDANTGGVTGRGIHRQYDGREIVIALVLRAVSQTSLPIGHLINIAETLRDRSLALDEIRGKFNTAIAGQTDLFMIFDPRIFGGDLEFLASPLSDKDCRSIYSQMIEKKSSDFSLKIVCYLSPWLQRARTVLPK